MHWPPRFQPVRLVGRVAGSHRRRDCSREPFDERKLRAPLFRKFRLSGRNSVIDYVMKTTRGGSERGKCGDEKERKGPMLEARLGSAAAKANRTADATSYPDPGVVDVFPGQLGFGGSACS